MQPVKLEAAKALRRQMTPAERLLWNALRNKQFHRLHFRRQQVIDGFIADFYCHTACLVVEVDGPIHQKQPDYDSERDAVFARRRLRVLRIANEGVQTDLRGVLDKIKVACAEAT